jgi:hypothetical protein
MTLARVFTAAAACVALGAAVAACSGSFGSGTGLPQTLASPNFGPAATSPTPATASSVVLTYGESTAFQPLPEVGGYGAAIAFPKAPAPTAAPSPKSKGKNATPEPAPTPVAVAIGATLSIVKPQDGPDLNFVSGKGKRRRTRELPARALAYITLLPTHDATLESYPRIAIDIPREVASQYRDGEFGLALWNSGEKDAKYRMAVSELDTAATPPPIVRATTAPLAAASAKSSASPGASPSATPSLPAGTRVSGSPAPGTSPGASPAAGGVAVPSAQPTLPPARMVFAGTASALKLMANRPAVFAVYALPHPAAAGAKAASGSPGPASASGSPHPSGSGSPHPSGSAAPAASGSPAASSAPAPAPAKSP